jgi:2-dehydropantoate 2-reductase
VKAYALEGALDRLAPAALDGAVVLPLLNGLEHIDRLRARLAGLCGDSPQGNARVAAGSVGRVEAFSPEPGVIVQRTQGATVTAASSDLGHEELRAALAPLDVPGLDLVVADDEHEVLWDKVARLAVLAAATVASGAPVGALRADDAWRARLVEALAETCAVAAADGVAVEPAGQWAIIEAMAPDLTTSTARDAAAGRPTELDAITGAVVRAGRRLGVPTPALERLLEDARSRSAAPA